VERTAKHARGNEEDEIADDVVAGMDAQ